MLLILLVRARLIDSMIDGAVYVMTIAAGFALVEDVFYFTDAAAVDDQTLYLLVLVRGLLTPFAHPLFSLPMGLAAGYIATRRPGSTTTLAVAAGAYAWSVGLHAAWNGTLYAADGRTELLWIVGALFVALFAAAAFTLVKLRHAQRTRFDRDIPGMASALSLSAGELELFSSTDAYLRHRRELTRADRKAFGHLRWTLHAMVAVRRLPAHSPEQSAADEIELSDLMTEANALRWRLFPDLIDDRRWPG